MKIVSFNEINRCIQTVKKLSNSGRSSIYGRGSNDVVINENTIPEGLTLMDWYLQSDPPKEISLEFGNLTIGAGADVKVTDVRKDANGKTINGGQVGYIKVNGTLIVNGHLHMDCAGGEFTNNTGDITNDGTTNNYNNNLSVASFLNYPLQNVGATEGCSDELWARLTNYGAQETFFTGKVALTGAASSGYCKYLVDYQVWEEDEPKINPYNTQWGRWIGYGSNRKWQWNRNGYQQYLDAVDANSSWHTYYDYITRGSISNSCLSGSGLYTSVPKTTENDMISCGGGGGGFLAIYSESIVNLGPKCELNGRIYPLNIHANGGTEIKQDVPYAQAIRGGGALIISAKKIIIGPEGSITADGGNGQGLMTLLNRPPYTELMTYNNGNPAVYTNTFSGGAGYAQFFQR